MIRKLTEEIKLTEGMRWLWKASSGYRLLILLCMSCGMLRMMLSLFFVWVCKYLIDVATHQTEGTLTTGCIIIVACLSLQLVLSAISSRLRVFVDISMTNQMRNRLYSHLLQSRWFGKESFHSGDVLNRMGVDVATVVQILTGWFPSLGITLVQLAGASVFLLILDKRMAVIIIVIMPLLLAFSKIYMLKMRRLTREVKAIDSELQSYVQENIQHRTLLSAFEQIPLTLNSLDRLQMRLKQKILSRNSVSIYSSTLVQMGFSIGYVVAFMWGIYGLEKGTVTFGVLTAFIQLVNQVQRPMVELSKMFPFFINGLASVERLHELTSQPLEEQGEPVILSGGCGIRLDNVSFSYPGGRHPVLTHFSFDFTPGSLTSVVGETGSGKSTLVRLMLALLLPDEGTITLYNASRTMISSPLTRGNFIYVPQGNTLISGTLRANLQLGNPSATDKEMREALYWAAADFVDEWIDGLDTYCGEGGAGWSEGQAQRIAIARALLRPGSIVLLDEPTSALDRQTISVLLRRLREKVKNKTIILITHQAEIAHLCTNQIKL